MKITFKKEWFNPLYFILNDILKDNTIRTVLVYGGKSSSKTVSIAQILSKESAVKASNTIAFRKQTNLIKTTLKESFNLAIKNMYLYPLFDTLEFSYRCDNGSQIVLKGLDTDEKAKGIESFKYLYIDELNHFTLDEYEQFQMSLRGIEGQKVFASWNPVDEDSWVKTELIDLINFTDTDKYGVLPCKDSFVRISDDGLTVLIKTTYPDNYWIVGSPDGSYGFKDVNLIKFYEQMKFKNFNSYKVNVLGEWGKTVFGGEFLKMWKPEKHVGSYPYERGLAVRLIFDENVNPYFPCGIFQIKDNELRLIHIIAMRNPDNTVKAMGREIIRKLREWKHIEAVYIGGDATSQKEDVKQEKGHDLFVLLASELKEYNPRRIVGTSNPSVRFSADFVNDCLENDFPIKFRVDISCKLAIMDYQNTKEDKNGKVDKTTVKDPKTGISHQPYGHITDLTRYSFVQSFPKEYANYQRGNIGIGIITAGSGRNAY